MLQCDITCSSQCSCSHISCGYPKKVWLIYVYINYNACANACMCILRFSCYIAIARYMLKYSDVRTKHGDRDDGIHWHSSIFYIL